MTYARFTRMYTNTVAWTAIGRTRKLNDIHVYMISGLI
mgnify:CR=1 FL=1